MQLKYKSTVKSLEKQLKKAQRKVVPLAASSAINKSTAKALTQARRRLTAQAGVPQKLFKSSFKTFKASPRRMRGKLWVGLKFGRSIQRLSAGQRKRFWKSLGVESTPFRATMRSGHTSTFARVTRTASSKGTKGWSKGRPRSSSRNLPIMDLERATVRLDERTAQTVVADLGRNFIPKEFSRTFEREVKQRLKRLGL